MKFVKEDLAAGSVTGISAPSKNNVSTEPGCGFAGSGHEAWVSGHIGSGVRLSNSFSEDTKTGLL
jgi:hypothetical protein